MHTGGIRTTLFKSKGSNPAEVLIMHSITLFALAAVATVVLAAASPVARAQVSINIGVEPACPYGYYDYAPYNCSPNGYYGPQYFNSGVFIGVGPWFHGASDFHGTVNNRLDPQHGYKGAVPHAGDKAAPQAKAQAFKGNEERDGRGNVAKGGKR
jgi:hypothetical protein